MQDYTMNARGLRSIKREVVECGACINCLDRSKFGGLGLRKQACVKRPISQKVSLLRNQPGQKPQQVRR